MKAVIQTKQGSPDILKLREIEKPTPNSNEVLVKVHASTVTRGDVIMRKLPLLVSIIFPLFGVKRRRIPGTEVSGEIEEVGKDVKRFKKGDQVFGTTTGLKDGANAEYVCLPEKWKQGVLTLKPSNMSYEEAASIPVGGMTALYLLKKANIQTGQRVLVYGASGSVGTYAVQLAKYFGAEVTAVSSTSNLEWVKDLGADKILDYTKEDFSKNNDSYDIIFDAVGKLSSSLQKSLLKENGARTSVKSPTKEIVEELNFLKKISEEGKLKAVIDKRFPLEKIVDAHKYVDKGHKKGNVVVTMISGDQSGR